MVTENGPNPWANQHSEPSLEPDEAAVDVSIADRLDSLLELLGSAGWAYGEVGPYPAGSIILAMMLYREDGSCYTVDELKMALPVLDESGELIEGFIIDTEDSRGYVEYAGPVNESFGQFVDAVTHLLLPE